MYEFSRKNPERPLISWDCSELGFVRKDMITGFMKNVLIDLNRARL